MEATTEINHKNVFYPPGGILLWIIIFLEVITFGIALIAMIYYGRQEAEVFHTSKMHLNVTIGTINTIMLITSGYFMATSLLKYKSGDLDKSKIYLKLTMVFGVIFLVLKSVEYYQKIEAGYTMGHNTFYTFYWMLTLFHVIHVMVGLVILLLAHRNIKKSKSEDFEASATFWHMCDLIWLLVFPVVYLFF